VVRNPDELRHLHYCGGPAKLGFIGLAFQLKHEPCGLKPARLIAQIRLPHTGESAILYLTRPVIDDAGAHQEIVLMVVRGIGESGEVIVDLNYTQCEMAA
jgi:hypothetical protein